MKELEELNAGYIRSVQESDVAWFREHLAPDFLCTNPDGTLLDREQFLRQTAEPVKISGLRAEDVKLRVYGDFAIIHARTRYTQADGRAGAGRYTDIWGRRDGRWLALAAHVTRA